MKKILSIILIATMISTILVGCSSNKVETSNNNNNTVVDANKENTNETTTTEVESTEKEEQTSTEKTETSENNETTKTEVDEKAKYENYLKDIKIELLAVSAGIPFSDMLEDGFYPADYDNKTSMITIGITYPDEEASSIIKSIEFRGETAKHPTKEGEYAFQTLKEAYESKDDLYSIYIYTVQGTIDPSEIHMHITTKNEDVFEDRFFENNGTPVGFDNASEKMNIWTLNDRHYLLMDSRKIEYSLIDRDGMQYDKRYEYIVQYRMAFLPLEGGYIRSLTIEDLTLVGDIDDDIEFKPFVREEHIHNGTNPIHTVIYLTARKHVDSVPLNEDGSINRTDSNTVLKDIEAMFENTYIEVTNTEESTIVKFK